MAEGDAGPFAAPESYFFLGAANNHNEVICVPRGAEYNTFIYSTNEGLDYRTCFFSAKDSGLCSSLLEKQMVGLWEDKRNLQSI